MLIEAKIIEVETALRADWGMCAQETRSEVAFHLSRKELAASFGLRVLIADGFHLVGRESIALFSQVLKM